MSSNESTIDCLYGKIELPDIMWKITETQEFQRMKKIKQLGGAAYIGLFQNAKHTRYQHSIGTAYFAIKKVGILKEEHPDLNVDGRDILCIGIAALCHDLGHGPFSHVFQEKVLPQLTSAPRKHKERSYEIFHKIWKAMFGNLPDDEQPLHARDLLFIKELITGSTYGHTPRYRGRESKQFLYQVLSSESSNDLCKIDYIARDCLYMGLPPGMACGGKGLVLYTANGEAGIACTDQLLVDYKLLSQLHQDVYQNAQVNAVELMISDAIVWADDELHISINCHDLEFFCKWDDEILLTIKDLAKTKSGKIQDAKKVLERIENRQHYKFVQDLHIDKDIGREEIIQKLITAAPNRSLSAESIRVAFLDSRAKQPEVPLDKNVIQVFCVNLKEESLVCCACMAVRHSLQQQQLPSN